VNGARRPACRPWATSCALKNVQSDQNSSGVPPAREKYCLKYAGAPCPPDLSYAAVLDNLAEPREGWSRDKLAILDDRAGNAILSALILFAIAMPFLYAARRLMHDFFRSVGNAIGGPLRLGAAGCSQPRETCASATRTVLLQHGASKWAS